MKFNTFKAVQSLSDQNLSNMYKHKEKNNFLLFVITKHLDCKCLTFLYYIYPNCFAFIVQPNICPNPVFKLVMRKSELSPVNNML